MENGAEEPEQSETLAERRISADSEEATTTNSLQEKEVYHAVEAVPNEHSLHSNGKEFTLADEDTLRNVSGIDFSVSTLDKRGDSGTERILEDHSVSTADSIENISSVSSGLSKDGAKEGKEPENENSLFIGAIGRGTDRNENLPTSKELSIASDTNEDLPTLHHEVSEENLGLGEFPSLSDSAQDSSAMEDGDVELRATNDDLTTELNAADVIPSAEDDKGIEPAQADEERTKDEGVALETPSTTDSAASVTAEEINPFDSLSASEESRKEETQTDKLDVTPATVEERGIEDKDLRPEEALPKETEVDEAKSNQESPESVTVVQDEGPSRTENDEAGKGTEPVPADEEQAKDEGVALGTPSSTDSAAAVAAEDDNPGVSLAASEESRKETQRDELDVTPATVEGTGVEGEDLEPEEALPKETDVDDAQSSQESPESVTVVQDEGPYRADYDEADKGIEPAQADEEKTKDEGVAFETPSTTNSAASVSAEEDNPFDSISASEESRKEGSQWDELDVTPATVEERGVEDKDLEPAKALPKETEVDHAQLNQESPESVPVVEVEGPSTTENDKADKGTEPVPGDEEQAKEEGVALGTPSTTDSVAAVAAEEDSPCHSLSASEESREEDTRRDELDVIPATVEERGVEDKDLEPEEALPTVVEDEAPSSTETDKAAVGFENTEPEPATTDAELFKDESFIDEVPPSTISSDASSQADSVPLHHQVLTDASVLDKPGSTGESAEATPVEDEKDVAGIATEELMGDKGLAEILPGSFNALERDEDLEPAEPSEGKEPVESGSTAEFTEVTPVEEAKNGDLNLAATVEDQNADVVASTPESTEVTPESTDEIVLDEPPSTGESAEATTVQDKKDVTGVATEELTEDKGLGDELPGIFNNLERGEDLESAKPPVDTTPDELELSPDSTDSDLIEDPKNVGDEEHLEFTAPAEGKEPDELGSTVESTEVTPVEDSINDEDLESALPSENEHSDELASTPECTDVTPVGDASTVNHNDLEPVIPKVDTKSDGLVLASDLTEDAPIEDIKNAEPVQDLLKDDSREEEKPSTGQFAETCPGMEDKSAEVPISHEELGKETETKEVASTSDLVEGPPLELEKASDELNPARNSGDVILVDDAYDEERINAPNRLDKVEFLGYEIPSIDKLGDSDSTSLVEDGTDAEPLTGDEVVTEEDNIPDGISLISDSSDATVVEDEDLESSKDSEALTSQEKLPGEGTMTDEFSDGLEARDTTSFGDSDADGLLEADKSVNEDPGDTPTLEDVEASTSQEVGKEETETSPPIEDKGTELLTSHEELAKKTETEEVVPTSELIGGNPVEDEKDIGGEGLNEDDAVSGSAAANLVIEDRNMEFLTPSEELPKEETAEDESSPVPQSPEVNADDRATDVELNTADELSKDEGSPEKVSTDSMEEISAVEFEGGESSILHEEDVEASSSQELGKEEIVDEAAQSPETSNVTPLEGAIDGEVLIDEKNEHLAEEILMNTADAIPAAEDQNVEDATSAEQLAKEGTRDEVAEHLESVDATLVDDSKDGKSVITDDGLKKEDRVASETLLDTYSANAVPVGEDKDFGSPATHEELAKDDHAVLDDSVLTSGSGWATSGVVDEAVEASTPHEELAKEETEHELVSAPGSGEATVVEDAVDGEPVIGDKEVNNKEDGASEAASTEDSEDATSAPEKKDSDALHDFELAKEADFPEELQRTSPLTQFDDKINDTFEDAVQPLVKEEGSTDETFDQTFSSATDDKVEERETPLEKTAKPVLTGESIVSDGDDILDRTVESTDPAPTADLGGATLVTQGHEAHIINSFHSLHSAVQTTSSSKVIQTRDLDPDLLQELPEKAQNVAQDSEEDMTSVPLSTQPTDLSSSWVSVSPIQEVQSASAGSQIRLSQKSQSRRPDGELTYDGDDWRIVSEQDVSALGVSKDVDTGSSGMKFPFSIVLWCSQSLFGGHKKIRND